MVARLLHAQSVPAGEYDATMKWADRQITRKAIRYSTDGYLPWGQVSEAPGPSAKTIVARLEAPFFTKDVYCENSKWWICATSVTDDRIPSPPPLFLCGGDAYEADVWLAVAHQYLVALASQIGSQNPELTDPDLSHMLRSNDGRDSERLSAIQSVVDYLSTVDAGIGHYNPATRQLAGRLLRMATPTLTEFQYSTFGDEETLSTVAARKEGNPTCAADSPIDEDEVKPLDTHWWNDSLNESFDEDADWHGQNSLQNEEAFSALPVSNLCRLLGFRPFFGIHDRSRAILFLGDEGGLQIGSENSPELRLTTDSDRWVLRLVHNRWEENGELLTPIINQHDIGAISLSHGEVAYLVTQELRRLAPRSEGEELGAVLNGLMYWGAVTSRAEDAFWAVRKIADSVDEDVRLGDLHQAMALLINGRYLSPKHRRMAEYNYHADYDLEVDYFMQSP